MESSLPFASDWIQRLIQESDDEVREQARWPILPMLPDMRKLVWSLCASLGVSSKGVPGNACRLMEKYLSRHLKKYSQTVRNSEEWDRYKSYMANRFCLLMASCLQLSAKMCTSTMPLSVAKVRAVLVAEGYEHTKEEIRQTEYHVYKTLDFRLPIWTSLETAQFLAKQVTMTTTNLLTAVGLVTELTEYNRYNLELHMQCWNEVCNSSEAPSTGEILLCTNSSVLALDGKSISVYSLSESRFNRLQTGGNPQFSCRKPRLIMRNIHLCAGAVLAAAQYMSIPSHERACHLATFTQTTPVYLNAIANSIYNHIITEDQYIPILKRRRLK